MIVPLTGPDGPVGTSIANAAKLALLDTGEQTIRITDLRQRQGRRRAAATQRRSPRATG